MAYLEGLLDLDSDVLNTQQEEGDDAAHCRSEPQADCPQAQRHKGQPDHQELRSVPAETHTYTDTHNTHTYTLSHMFMFPCMAHGK